MLNLEEIDSTINELENSTTTFETCSKLSTLYIVRDHLQNAVQESLDASEDKTEDETINVLPSYVRYLEVKRKYQLHETTEDIIVIQLNNVCKELDNFLHLLYSSTDTVNERTVLKNLIANLKESL